MSRPDPSPPLDPPVRTGLGPSAFEPIPPGESYQPYVGAEIAPPELTVKSIVAGILFGIAFGAANAYLGLRAGLTISTSIPVAVMTVAAFRALHAMGAKSSILEANLSQTVGSASSSVASGVIFTLPALFLWGFAPSLLQMTLLAMCGGLLGVLFMVPLRRFLIEREHGRLPYPEGTACAQVLVASEVGGAKAKNVFIGLGVGALFKFLVGWARIFPDEIEVRIPLLKKGQLGSDVSAALFGVGYILGPRIALIMVGGGLLSWLVLIPAIAWWGESLTAPLYPETVRTIAEMEPGQIWTRYVRYIGAGAVATGGLITLIRSVPTMIESFRIGARQIRRQLGAEGSQPDAGPRTDRDLSLRIVGGGALVIVLVLGLVPQVFGALEGPGQRLVAAVLVAIFAFFFVTVASRIVGLVGVTSNPTSGMTIATLLATSSIFLLLGWTGDLGKMAALTIGCVVAIAASIAGDTSQDLKTGFLLGATPVRQQVGELIGVLTSAVFVCLTVIALSKAYGFGTQELPAPQATLMKLVIDGVLSQSLPWAFVGIGVAIALLAEAFRIPSLPFAVGVYLPVSTMVPVFFGGALRWWLERGSRSEDEKESRREAGVLMGSGLVGGEGLMGVGIALAAGWAVARDREVWEIGYGWLGAAAPWVAAAAFAALIALFWRVCVGRRAV
ncbi:MAG TPA: oligopeptide transporter, OPT family [Thermoanaerobaculia bacterium]|nr:oligopeptide transporter, OPT family [Thermoanaerobaculia bacterium]